MEKLKYIFDITYGTKLDKNKTIERNDKSYLCRYHNIEEKIIKKKFNWFIITNLLVIVIIIIILLYSFSYIYKSVQ